MKSFLKSDEHKVYAEPVYRNGRLMYCVYNARGDYEFREEVEVGDVVYRPPPLMQRLADEGVLFLPEEPQDYGDEEDLNQAIYDFLYRYVDYPDEYRLLDTAYVRLTWVYDKFSRVPYRMVVGKAGTGKTRWATVLVSICRLGYIQGAVATPAAVFRLCDIIRGTMMVDETHFGPDSESAQTIMAILNSGYGRDCGYVVRCEGERHIPEPFVTYGPKIIVAQTLLPNEATRTRTIVHYACETERRDLPVHLDKEFWRESLRLRNKLLKWRIDHVHRPLGEDKEFLILPVSPRIREVLYPLVQVAGNDRIRGLLYELARRRDRELREDRGMSREAVVLKGVIRLLTRGEHLSMGNIAEEVKVLEPEWQYTVSPRRVGSLLRSMGFRVERKWDPDKHSNPYTLLLESETDLQWLLRQARLHGVDEQTIRSLMSIMSTGKEKTLAEQPHPETTFPAYVNDVIDIIVCWLNEVSESGKKPIPGMDFIRELMKLCGGQRELALKVGKLLVSRGVLTRIRDSKAFRFDPLIADLLRTESSWRLL